MFRFMRTMTVNNLADLPAALQSAAETTSHLNKTYQLNVKFGLESYGQPRIHWHFDFDSVDSLSQTNVKILQDRDYLAMGEKAKHLWLPGSTKDTLVRFRD